MFELYEKIRFFFSCSYMIVVLFLFISCGQNTTERNVPSNKFSSDAELLQNYTRWGGEAKRLFINPQGIVERLRTESILRRFLPKPPAVVYDIGGGTGVYAFPLAEQGYEVHLVDIVPLHIEQATKKMHQTGVALAEIVVGDARALNVKDGVADIVLLFGPLYHLLEKQDRLKALREAHRILKPGGMLFAVAIMRSGVVFNEAKKNRLHDPYHASMLEKMLKTGIYSNPRSKRFTTGYFHQIDEFESEVKSSGFKEVLLRNVEGPVTLLPALNETVNEAKALDGLLHFLEVIEKDRSIMGAGGHIMAICRK